MKSEQIYIDDDSRLPCIGTIYRGVSLADVNQVVNAPVDTSNGRSEWVWVRLANGDLLLGVFPQGDTYIELQNRLRI